MSVVLLDTDVLIDYLRGQSAAVAFVRGLAEVPSVSALTIGELYAGVREGAELTKLDAMIDALDVFPVTPEIAARGGLFKRDFGPSHGVGFVDALIGATTLLNNATLYTLNVKHYPMVPKGMVITPYEK